VPGAVRLGGRAAFAWTICLSGRSVYLDGPFIWTVCYLDGLLILLALPFSLVLSPLVLSPPSRFGHAG
ncbi:MAG: hypothetical protein ACKOZX_03445, partial [Gammaproteobacteria bacterium]